MQHGGAVEAEDPDEAVDDYRGRCRARKAGKRLGLGPRLRGLGSSAGCERHEAADDRGDGHEHRQGKDVLSFADRERVERRREVPVDEQETEDRRGKRRPEPADSRDADDDEQEEQQDAR